MPKSHSVTLSNLLGWSSRSRLLNFRRNAASEPLILAIRLPLRILVCCSFYSAYVMAFVKESSRIPVVDELVYQRWDFQFRQRVKLLISGKAANLAKEVIKPAHFRFKLYLRDIFAVQKTL